jgi:hypothetical protein
MADQWNQLLGETFAQAAGRGNNGWRVGTRSSLPRQHATEHSLPHVVARRRLATRGPDSIFAVISHRSQTLWDFFLPRCEFRRSETAFLVFLCRWRSGCGACWHFTLREI